MSRQRASAPVPALRADAPRPAPHWLRPAIAALFLALAAAWTSNDVRDPDTWQHLVSGKYIVERHRFPWPDPFSFTTAMVKPAYAGEEITRKFNIQHELLAQALIYLSYAGGGFAGLVLLRTALITAFCVLIGFAAWLRTSSFYRALAAALLAGFVAAPFAADRPQLFSFVFLAATLVILDHRRPLWLLPPLFLIWGNTHGGFILGWAVLGIYCAETLYWRWRGRPAPDERRLWLAAAVSVAVSGLNYTGFDVLRILVAYRQSIAQTTIWEWQHPAFWPPPRFSILLAAGAAVLLWARRRVRLADWLLFFIFGAAAETALRNMFLAAVAAPLVIVTYVPWKCSPAVACQYVTAVFLAVLTAIPILQGHAFQFHAAEWKFPARAADFVQVHHLSDRMLNSWEFGAYLIWKLWPLEHVFIDGRAQSETVFLDYQRIIYDVKAADEPVDGPYQALRPRVVSGKSAEQLLDQYGIGMILMDGFEFTTGSPYILVAALADPRQTAWKLVYRDSQAVIFLRHPPADLLWLNPLQALDAMEDQCREHLRHDPETPRCAAGMADVFERLGDRARSSRWKTIALEHGVQPE
jgi:hypothetical protein